MEVKSINDESTKEKLQQQIDQLRKEIDSHENIDNPNQQTEYNTESLQETYKQLARLLEKQGRVDEAEKILREAIHRG